MEVCKIIHQHIVGAKLLLLINFALANYVGHFCVR